MSINVAQELTGADAEYGYVYGCEGLMGIQKVAEFLGVHENTVRNLCRQGYLRRGKRPDKNGVKRMQSKAVVCRRSLREYVALTQE